MIDFQVLEVAVARDLQRKVSSNPVHRARVLCLHTQEERVFSDLYGSWNTEPDQDGRFKNASPAVAAVLQERVTSGAVEKANPFIAPANPFLSAVTV